MKNGISKKYGLLLGLSILVITIIFEGIGAFSSIELKVLDIFFRLRGKEPPSSQVVIIGIDDESIEKIGRFPWSRDYHAALIEILTQFNASAIGFDIFFTEPEKNYPKNDLLLAEASQNNKNTYFAFFTYLKEEAENSEKTKPLRKEIEKELSQKFGIKPLNELSIKIPKAEAVTLPLRKIYLSAKGIGLVNAIPDQDGVTRRIPLMVKYGNFCYPSLGFKVASDYLGLDLNHMDLSRDNYLSISGKAEKIIIPINNAGEMIINYPGPIGTFKWYSYVRVLKSFQEIQAGRKPLIDLNEFSDKIVLIGANATGTTDLRPTPFSPIYPMVAVQATAISNILQQNFLREAPTFLNISFLILIGLTLSLILPALKTKLTFPFILLILITTMAAGYGLFYFKGLWVHFFTPFFLISLTYLSIILYRYLQEEKERKRVKRVFQNYVSREIVEEVLNDPDKLGLGGKRKLLTVLFADIRGFTTFSEKATPEEVVHMLNEYLTAMTAIIFKHGGTIDKFMGDCIMAIFGAPIEQSDHARRAVQTAIEMQKEMENLKKMWQSSGKKSVDAGIGINSGDMVVGNIGSENIMDYTVIGDNVNLAARLQSNASGGEIIISAATYKLLEKDIPVEKLPAITVKGKKDPVEIYRVKV